MSGRIPQEFIDELITRLDVVEIVGARVQLKKAGREYKGLCPFHGEKTPSFTVSGDKGFYHCFGCGAHGTALGFLMEFEHLSFVEAVEESAAQLGLQVPREAGKPKDRRIDQLFELMRRAEQFYVDALRESQPAIDYVKNRGIDGATCKQYRIGYAPGGWDALLSQFPPGDETRDLLLACGLVIRNDSGRVYDRFRERLMFPIRDSRGRTVGFGGRVLDQQEPKYLNSPETVLFHKGRELYGLYEARKKLRDISRLLVVEGYMDVVALARHGINNAVATLGTATTPEHLNRLFRVCDEVVFCFDGDRAGRAAAWRALENALSQAREGRQIRFVFLPDGEDPDTLVSREGSAAFEAVVDAGIPLSEFMVRELSAQVDMGSVDGRARMAELARPLLAKIPTGVYRELLLQRLGESIGISAGKLEQMLAGDRTAAAAPQPANKTRLNTGSLSPVARAIQLLLHEPAIAREADLEPLAGLQRPGIAQLIELIAVTQAESQLNTAGLLERWRHRQHGEYLARLAATPLPEHEEITWQQEFDGYLRDFADARRRDRVEQLKQKSGQNGLDDAEREELKNLLAGRI